MQIEEYQQLMQLVDDLEHEECSKHQDCKDKNNPCIFNKNGMCVIFCFSGLLDELSSKNEVGSDELDNARKVLAEYCAKTECEDCENKFWCSAIRAGYSPYQAQEIKGYDTPNELIKKLIETGWQEVMVKKDDIRYFKNKRIVDKEDIVIIVPLDDKKNDYNLLFFRALKIFIDYNNGKAIIL